MINRIIKKFVFICGIRKLSDWKYSQDLKNTNNSNWMKIIKKTDYIFSNSENNLYLKTNSIGYSAWCLFGIKHKGENRKCFGTLKSGILGYSQSRTMYPVRRRWRVVRIKKNNPIYVSLHNVKHQININEIWLIPLLPWHALLKVINRYMKTNPHIKINLFSKKFRLDLWKKYNFFLNSQINSLDSLVSYKDWIEIIERKDLNYLSLNLKSNNQTLVKIFDWDYPSLIEGYEYCIPLKKGDLLSKNALKIYKNIILKFPNCKIFYSDEDFVNDKGERILPNFKPAWNRELVLSNPSFGRSWVIKVDLWNSAIKKLNSLKILPSIEIILLEIFSELQKNNETEKIGHLPMVCYHQNISNLIKNKDNYYQKYACQLLSHLKRNEKIYGTCLSAEPSLKNNGIRLKWNIPEKIKLSIIIPIKDKISLLKKCLNSIEKSKLEFPLEIIVVDNKSEEEKTKSFLKKFENASTSKISKKLISYNKKFNYSKINNFAVKHSSGDVILFLNNDVEFISTDWAYELCSNALRPNVGFVGGKLLFEDKTIQHAGVILGIGGVAGHSHKYFDFEDSGYQNRLDMPQEYSAMTAACLAVSRNNWDKIGGFNETEFKINYNDVDICLRARKLGLINIYLPFVLAYHFESKTRGRPEGSLYRKWRNEFKIMKRIWGKILLNDPAYNPNLSLDNESFTIGLNKNRTKFILRKGFFD